MIKDTLISICIPAYEKPAALKRLLESIAMQRHKQYEVIVTDDSFTDQVEKVITSFNDLSLQYYRNPNRGMAANWNYVLSKASAPWIKMMHDDDWFADENALGKFVEVIKNTGSPFIYSGSYHVNAKTNDRSLDAPSSKKKYLREALPLSLLFSNIIGHPSVTMFKNDPQLRFDEQFKWVIDIDFYIRYLSRCKQDPFAIDLPLINITNDEKQVSAGCYKNPNVEIPEYLNLLSKFEDDLHLHNKFAFYCIWELIRKFKIKDTGQFHEFGFTGSLPKETKIIIGYQQKIPLLILKQPPLNKLLMDHYFRKMKTHAL
jgi:glycosyltransferase involved in cell wall biosynthesis